AEFVKLLRPVAAARLAAEAASAGDPPTEPGVPPSSPPAAVTLPARPPQARGALAMDPYLIMVRLFMEPPYNQAVDEALASAQIPEDRRAAIRAELVAQLSVPVPVSQVLSAGGRRPWFEGWDPSAGYYWPRQRQYLVARLHRSPVEVESLD